MSFKRIVSLLEEVKMKIKMVDKNAGKKLPKMQNTPVQQNASTMSAAKAAVKNMKAKSANPHKVKATGSTKK